MNVCKESYVFMVIRLLCDVLIFNDKLLETTWSSKKHVISQSLSCCLVAVLVG